MAGENSRKACRVIVKSIPYIAMISLQFGYAGMYIITKVSLNRGMSHYVLVVYRHATATAVMAPFAYFVERKIRPRLTFWMFCQIFALALLGPVLDQNFYYAGLKFTSPTFASAIFNVMPAMTFVMASLFGMERVNIREVRSKAKLLGTAAGVGGAMLMTLYKGPILNVHSHTHHSTANQRSDPSDREWIEGSILLVASCLAWAAFFVLQAAVLNKYSAHLSLTTLICFLGTLQSIAVTLAIEHDPSVWKIGWDMNLLTAVYSGVVASGIAYYVQGLCMKIKGPVFATAFGPLTMIIVAIMSSIILSETIYLGSVVGGVVLVAGLYAVLWGKVKDQKISMEAQNKTEILPSCHVKDAAAAIASKSDEFTEMSNDSSADKSKENGLHQTVKEEGDTCAHSHQTRIEEIFDSTKINEDLV